MHHEVRMQLLKKTNTIFSGLSSIRFFTKKKFFQTYCEKEIRASCDRIQQKCLELEKIIDELYFGERSK